MKIILDAGHGPETPGKRSPDGMREFDFNSRVADVMKAELECYEGVTVYFTHDSKRDVSLKDRTNRANALKADVFISLHANANSGKMGDWGGIETFAYTSKPKEAVALATKIQSALVKATGLRNRGVKFGNYHVLRETHMTAILIEHAFMDSKTDLPKLKSDAFRKLCGETNARTVAEFYGLKRKSIPKPSPKPAPAPKPSAKVNKDVFYRVVTGSFNDRANAESRIAELKKVGFDSFITIEEAKK